MTKGKIAVGSRNLISLGAIANFQSRFLSTRPLLPTYPKMESKSKDLQSHSFKMIQFYFAQTSKIPIPIKKPLIISFFDIIGNRIECLLHVYSFTACAVKSKKAKKGPSYKFVWYHTYSHCMYGKIYAGTGCQEFGTQHLKSNQLVTPIRRGENREGSFPFYFFWYES